MLIEIYVNGDWDASLENDSKVTIFNRGIVYQLDDSLYDYFIKNLEEKGYDCYFCPQLFRHPDWNGIIENI